MQNTKSNKERIHDVANKMGVKFVDKKDNNILNSRMLNISKPGRPQVRESIQRYLDNVVGRG